jgi:hypothetical protein
LTSKAEVGFVITSVLLQYAENAAKRGEAQQTAASAGTVNTT